MNANFQDQLQIVKTIQSVTGALSVIGSSTILYLLLGSKNKLSSPYRRIIFGMSICDVIGSFAFSLSYVPRTSQAVCDAQGFFIHFGISATPIYNLSLCIYYVLTICYEKKEDWIRKRMEPFLHGLPILWSLGAAIYLVSTKHFNENGANCWIADKPKNCSVSPEIECERGENAIKYRWIFSVFQTLTIFALIVASMLMLVCKVKKQERVMNERFSVISVNRDEKKSLRKTLRCIFCDTLSSQPHASTTSSKNEVRNQALIYVAAYFLPFFFPVFNFLVWARKGISNIPILFVVSIFMPLQGVLNCFVYVRPKIMTLRKRDSSLTVIGSFLKILKDTRNFEKRHGQSTAGVKSVSIEIPEESSEVSL